MGLKFDEICIDAHDATALGGWWSKVLGWPQDVDDDGDVVLHAPPGAGPNWMIHRGSRREGRQEPHPPRLPARRPAGRGGPGDSAWVRGTSTSVRATRAGWCWPIRRATSSASWPQQIALPLRERARLRADTPRNTSILRTLAAVRVLSLAACGTSHTVHRRRRSGRRRRSHSTSGRRPGHGRRLAARRQNADPVRRIESHRRLAGSDVAQGNSGCGEGPRPRASTCRSPRVGGRRDFSSGCSTMGSAPTGAWTPPGSSSRRPRCRSTSGQAVDIAPVEADKWLIRNGPSSACQIYANEIWHFESSTTGTARR